MKTIVPNLWFDDNAEEAIAFYVSLVDNSRVTRTTKLENVGPEGDDTVTYVEFELNGQPYGAINGGPQFTFNEALSLELPCETQDEIDRVWAALSEGGEPGPCGWIKDRYGLSWQVTPAALGDMLTDPDADKVRRATAYFMGLDGVPFDLADLEAAFEGAAQQTT
ncbi:VOC family protein [Nocardioides mangrovicus]|uniref:VOC family protein n=1 Tax=Nocardioides mangrovicus TaxID=2478913 RepID=A0A3L8P240_9ACTN|nr:VOC family protein [Nocardioides mangrovicus]RLV48689.1 VOC family protein [Nocardioides mangrovicus]